MQAQETIRPIFVDGLRNAHAVEHQSLALLNRQAERLVNYPELEAQLRTHIAETHDQIGRLDAILETLDESASAVKDVSLWLSGTLATLSHRAADDEVIKNSLADYMFEHFEVASYTALIVMAEEGGFGTAIRPLRQSLEEEQAMAAFFVDRLPAVVRTFLARRMAGLPASH